MRRDEAVPGHSGSDRARRERERGGARRAGAAGTGVGALVPRGGAEPRPGGAAQGGSGPPPRGGGRSGRGGETVMRAAMLIPIALLMAGCFGPPRPARVADIDAGEFYTNDEIRGLDQEERNRYCAQLRSRIDALKAEADSIQARADSLRGEADSLRHVNRELSTEIRDLDGEIRQLRLARRAATIYTVKAGDTLQKIASVVYGTATRWRDIYEANRTRLGKPTDPLKAGMRLQIPAK
ncbi:MAG: LysM peptidoglycan-binding domain-containing protein [Candidatus Eisenbacteria bacterium]|nr:LysM peptidoglycan-binding domain-containing protein [Candidatus Latescibacterota bacterium]MBD3301732.1 LysM peptidoglycan-binding domain-containing protein [Candidatus Eisenbacteria bacterium]